MRKILVMQSRARASGASAERENYGKLLDGLAELSFASTLDGSGAWDAPREIISDNEGVILGGSAAHYLDGGKSEDDPARRRGQEIAKRITAFVEYLRTAEIPFFGVCFGHQLIAEIHGGKVTHDHSQKKTGTYEVRLTDAGKKDEVFGKLPWVFPAQYSHKDSVTRLPKDAVLLARSPVCKFSALRYGRGQYTTQFHPELSAEDAARRFSAVEGYVPKGTDIASVIRESPESSKLIPLWLEDFGFRDI